MAADLAQTLSITIGAALVDILGYRPLLIIAAAIVSIAAIPVLTHPAQPPTMHTQRAADRLTSPSRRPDSGIPRSPDTDVPGTG
jgi:hypothetical protein